MDPLTMLGIAGVALTAPGAVKGSMDLIDRGFGTDLTGNRRRATKAIGAQGQMGAIMSSQGFDGIVDQLALEAGLDSVPLNTNYSAPIMSMEDNLFVKQLIEANRHTFASSASVPAPTFQDLIMRTGGIS